jgi:hypothetical protein
MKQRNSSGTPPGRKTAKIVLLFSIVLFGFLLLSAFVWFPRTGILAVFTGNWVLFQGLSNFLLFFPAFFCSILLISLTLFPAFLTNSTQSFSSYAAFFIIIMMLYTGLREIGSPRFQNRLKDIRYLTQSGEELIEAAYEAEEEHDIERAYQNLKRYHEIDPNNSKINSEFDRIKIEYAAEQTEILENLGEQQDEPTETDQNTAESLVKQAAAYLEQNNFHSAYYYAAIAGELGSKEAEEIQEKAWNSIKNVTPGRESEENRLLFSQKAEGQSTLSYGNSIEAYYLFRALHESYPADSEIIKLLEETEEQLKEKAFFIDEVIQALSYPGYPDIFFILNKTETQIRLFFAKTGIITREGIFFQDIELFSINTADNTAAEHLYAPYGKCVDQILLMHCIHKTDEETQFYPRYITGPKEENPPSTLLLPFQAGEFQYFSRREHNTDILSFGDLLYLRKLWPVRGYRSEPVYIELLMRIMYPFSFLVFAFFTLSIGLRTKHISGRPSAAAYVLIPFLPFLIHYIIHFFYYLNRVFLSFLHSWLGFFAALIVLFVLQGILLLFSIGRSLKRMQG